MIGWPRRIRTFLALSLSLLLAGDAQYVIAKATHIADGWPLLSSFDKKLTELYRASIHSGEQSVAVAVCLFALAMLLFTWATSSTDAGGEKGQPATPSPRSHRSVPWARLLSASVGLAAGWSYLLARLATDQYDGWYVALFFGLLALTAALFAYSGGLRWESLAVRVTIWEGAFVLSVTGLFAGLVSASLTNWRYATLGDDGVFFLFAREIVNGEGGYNLFAQSGPSGTHPLLGSAYQAAVMDVAGVDIFGWRLATLVLLVATIPAFYVLVRALTNRRTALLATAVFSVSHYLLGYAHTGYDNIFPLLPTVIAFALFLAGTRRANSFLLFSAGVVAGFGFYTFYSARAIIVILALVLLFMGRKHWKPGTIVPLATGFALTVAPMFAVEGWNVISETLGESQTADKTILETLSGLAASAPRVFMAFNFNPYPKHFVSGSLLDDISAPLALLGLAYAATRVRNEGYRFLLIWFIVAMVVTGLFHPRQVEINSRLHYALPPMAVFAGIALDRILATLGDSMRRSAPRSVICASGVAVVLAGVLGLNLYRHCVEMPDQIAAPYPSLVLREAKRPECDQPELRTVVFAPQPFPQMPGVFDLYGWDEGRIPLFFRYDDPPSVYEKAIAAGTVGCLLIADPQTADSSPAAGYLAGLADQAIDVYSAADASGESTLRILRMSQDPLP